MALTLRRFLAILGLGMATVVALAIGLATTVNPFNESDAPVIRRARDRVADLDGAISALRRRDSIVAALRARPAARGLTIVVPPGGPPALRDSLTRFIRREWEKVAGDARAYPIVVLVRSNMQSRRAEEWLASDAVDVTLVPDEPVLNACVVDFYASRDLVNGKPSSYIGFDRLRRLPGRLAPCAVVARYGAPGPGAARWLGAEWWRAASNPVALDDISAPPRMSPDARYQPRSTGMFLMISGPGAFFFSTDQEGRWIVGMEGIQCLAGQDSACMSILRASAGPDLARGASLLPAGMIRRRTFDNWGWRRTMVASIERTLGPEKFAEFWKSADDPEVALARLFPGGAVQVVRDRLQESIQPLTSSPWPTAVEWLAHLALIGAAAGLMSLAAQSRTMKL